MEIKLSLTNLLLGFVILGLLVFSISLISDKNDLKKELTKVEKSLTSEKELPIIYKRTNDFIEKLSVANHKSFLTGKAKKEYEKAEKENFEYLDDEISSENASIKDVEILQTNGVKTAPNKAKIFSIYKVTYNSEFDTTRDASGLERTLIMTLVSSWEKKDNNYMVNEYEMNLLQDNLDEYLKKMSENE